MTLLVMLLAAVAATAVWYFKDARNELKTGTLCLMFWGAALMWLVDALFEYRELGAEYFTPAPEALLNDFFLGVSAVALGLTIWLVLLLAADPKGVLRRAF